MPSAEREEISPMAEGQPRRDADSDDVRRDADNDDVRRHKVFAGILTKRESLTFAPRAWTDHTTTTENVVVSFDTGLFNRKCNPSSTEYDSTWNLTLLASEIYKLGDTWASRDILESALKAQAGCEGWTVKKEKDWIGCNRYGEPVASRHFASGALQANCTLKLSLEALVSTRKLNANQKFKYSKNWSAPVKLVDKGNPKNFCTCHGGNCRPSQQNRIATQKRSGGYVKNVPDHALFTLANMQEHNGHLPTNTIKNIIRPVWPCKKEISKNDVFTIRLKVLRLLPVLKAAGGIFHEFQQMANDSDLLSGIDNSTSINDDEAYELAVGTFHDVINSVGGKNEDAVFKFVDYLELICARAKGFSYKLAEDNRGHKKKLVGVIWMTATMRKNFELYGDYIAFDMMKRGINTLLWPYVAVTMYNEMKKLCIGCEGMLAESRSVIG